jgi:hypothetical protein
MRNDEETEGRGDTLPGFGHLDFVLGICLPRRQAGLEFIFCLLGFSPVGCQMSIEGGDFVISRNACPLWREE